MNQIYVHLTLFILTDKSFLDYKFNNTIIESMNSATVLDIEIDTNMD